MKKLLAFISLMVFCLAGCENSNRVDHTTSKYTKVHFYDTGVCYHIEGWKDYSDSEQLDLNIEGCGWVLVTANNVMLVEDKCPICKK